MTFSILAARAAIGAAALALIALAALHLLRPDLDPSRTMISRYARGPYGWVMALGFAAFAAGSACLCVALAGHVPSLPARIGLAFLLGATVGLAMAAVFRMDPVSTAPDQMSFSGKMHGVSFAIGVPCLVLAALILSPPLGRQASHASLPLLPLTAVVWLSLVVMIATMLKVGPGHGPNPSVPRMFGWANRLLMVAYGVWLMVAAWPMAR